MRREQPSPWGWQNKVCVTACSRAWKDTQGTLAWSQTPPTTTVRFNKYIPCFWRPIAFTKCRAEIFSPFLTIKIKVQSSFKFSTCIRKEWLTLYCWVWYKHIKVLYNYNFSVHRMNWPQMLWRVTFTTWMKYCLSLWMTAFLGWNLSQQWPSSSKIKKKKKLFFFKMHDCEAKKSAVMMQLYYSNNEESRITVELQVFESNS